MLVHLLGFRCMLMRISLELHYGLSSPFEPDASNFKPFHELVDFVQQLNHNDVDGYWLICEFAPSARTDRRRRPHPLVRRIVSDTLVDGFSGSAEQRGHALVVALGCRSRSSTQRSRVGHCSAGAVTCEIDGGQTEGDE